MGTGRVVHPTHRFLTRYIPGLGVEKGRTNRIADTICPVCLGSRPNCTGSCGGGCTTKVKMGTRGWFTPLIGAPHPIYPRIGGRKRESEQNRRHNMSRAPGVAPQLCRILWWRMYQPGHDGYREGGSPLSTVSPTRYIPGLGVTKGRTNRIADTICPVRLGSRPNCAGSCGGLGGCTTDVKMGTGRVVPPTHW